MDDFNVLLALLGGTILVLGLGSAWLTASVFPPTFIALLIGVGIGPDALDLIDVDAVAQREEVLEKAARLALAVGLVGVALRIPSEYPRRNWCSLIKLIGLGMPLMWLISTALVYFILGLPFWLAALVGAILTPTDPVASTPIVTGALAEKNIPDRLRHAISFDSGANDGLAFLFVFLPFLMLTMPVGDALSHWFIKTFLWDVGFATALGLLLGYAAGKLLRVANRAGAMQSEWRLVYTAALGFLAVGIGKLVQSDEVLVVFAAAAAFDQVVSAPDCENEEQGQEAINRFFAIPIFILLGCAIPWDGWQELGWQGVLLALAVLLLRRPLTMLLLRPLLPDLRSLPDALFAGWFGPIAVAAIYYSSLMEHKLGEPLIWHIVSLVACASVAAHGITAAPLTRLYGKISSRHQSDEKAATAVAAPGNEN